MKKITVLVTTFLFLLSNNIQASFLKQFNPYSFGPEGRTVADLRDFAKPNQMTNILAGRPVAATKADGTRVYYTSDGKMSISIARDGSMSMSVGGTTKRKDSKGNLTGEETAILGENLYKQTNEHGDVTGYKKVDGNGKTIAEYDENMNKTRTYNYGEFGKTLTYSIDEMTQRKTVYDEYERAVAVYDPDGYVLTTYQYADRDYLSDEDKKTVNMVQKTSPRDTAIDKPVSTRNYQLRILNFDKTENGAGNQKAEYENYELVYTTTIYDKEGFISVVKDSEGAIVETYFYKQDDNKNNVLHFVRNSKTNEDTYYDEKNGKPLYVKNAEGSVIRRYYYDDNTLLFSAEIAEDGSWKSTAVGERNDIVANSDIVYNKNGTISAVAKSNGDFERYIYSSTDEYKIIRVEGFSADGTKKYVTKYDDNGCPTATFDPKEETKLFDYGYNNSKLVYSFNNTTKVTSWFDGNEKIVYETMDSRIMSKNIYNGGQLIGKWEKVVGESTPNPGTKKEKEELLFDKESYILTIYVNEREVVMLSDFSSEPTDAQVIEIQKNCHTSVIN